MAHRFEYPFAIRALADDEGGGYLLEFPDLPGCMADGQTPEEAIREGEGALRSWIETHRELEWEISLAPDVQRKSVGARAQVTAPAPRRTRKGRWRKPQHPGRFAPLRRHRRPPTQEVKRAGFE